MILYSNNKNKYFILFILVFITSSFIFLQYLKINKFKLKNNKVNNSNIEFTNKEVEKTFSDIKDSWVLAKDITINSKDDIEKELKRQELLEETKKYLEYKNSKIE